MMQAAIVCVIGSSWIDRLSTIKQESRFSRWVFVILAPQKRVATIHLAQNVLRSGTLASSGICPTFRDALGGPICPETLSGYKAESLDDGHRQSILGIRPAVFSFAAPKLA
jgi:hypothetical protein